MFLSVFKRDQQAPFHISSRAERSGDNLKAAKMAAEPTQPTLFILSAASASRTRRGGCHNTPSEMALILSTLHSITNPPRWVNSSGGLSSFGVCLCWDPDLKRAEGVTGGGPRLHVAGEGRPSRGTLGAARQVVWRALVAHGPLRGRLLVGGAC